MILAPPRTGPPAADRSPLGPQHEICVQRVTDGRSEGRRRRWALRRLAGDLLPGHRVDKCGWRAVPGRQITVTRDGEGRHGVAHAAVCGSVWVCPVCGAKIAAGRAAEVEQGIRAWQDRGGAVWMLTLTVNHNRGEALADLLRRQTASMRELWSGRWAKDWRERWGYAGMIRNLETTWGPETGWHPHSHVLLFVRQAGELDVARAASELAQRWREITGRRDFDVTLAHGARLEEVPTAEDPDADPGRDPESAAGYAAKAADSQKRKWGAAEELSWAHIKRARKSRWTPWDLLEAAGERTGMNDPTNRAPALWQEYADAYHGRRHLYWSKGLRDLLAIGQAQSDEELAEAHDGTAQEIATITGATWVHMRKHGAVLELLEYLDREADDADQSAQLCAAWLARFRSQHGLGRSPPEARPFAAPSR